MRKAGKGRGKQAPAAKAAATDLNSTWKKPKPRLAGRYKPTKEDLALYEKYQAQAQTEMEKPAERRRLAKRRECVVCRARFRPKRLKHFFCDTLRPACKWLWWDALHPRIHEASRNPKMLGRRAA